MEDHANGSSVSAVLGLAGRRAFVVGGYGGIGITTARLLADAGAAVAIGGRNGDRAATAAGALRDAGADAVGLAVDIADPQDVRRAVDEVVQQLGGVDILVNLASIDLEDKAETFAEEQWRQVIDINLSGAFWLSQAVAQHMIGAGGGGRIIHFSSTRSVAGGRRGFAAYAAAKGGLNNLVRQLATEWGKHEITVNAVGPGFVPTGLVAEAAGNEQFVQMMLRRIPMGRFGTPLEMAAAVLFLASPGGGFVNGQTLFVDGGVTASS